IATTRALRPLARRMSRRAIRRHTRQDVSQDSGPGHDVDRLMRSSSPSEAENVNPPAASTAKVGTTGTSGLGDVHGTSPRAPERDPPGGPAVRPPAHPL